MAFFLVGAGGHGKVVLDCLLASGYGGEIAFLDSVKSKGPFVGSYAIAGTEQELGAGHFGQDAVFIVSFGTPLAARARCFAHLISCGFSASSVAHPSSILSPYAKVEVGTLLGPKVVVNSGAFVGKNAILNSGSILEHDCSVGDHSHIAPGAVLAGGAYVGEQTLIGAGSVVLPGRHVGSNCVVGAGSVVTRDLPDGCVVYGNPARRH